jgi:hypothetical protein
LRWHPAERFRQQRVPWQPASLADITDLIRVVENPKLVVHVAPELVHCLHPPAHLALEKGCLASPYIPTTTVYVG